MSDGKGAEAQCPTLVNNSKLQSAEYAASVVLNGMGALLWFAVILNDQQIANIINYILIYFDVHYINATSPKNITMIRSHLLEKLCFLRKFK